MSHLNLWRLWMGWYHTIVVLCERTTIKIGRLSGRASLNHTSPLRLRTSLGWWQKRKAERCKAWERLSTPFWLWDGAGHVVRHVAASTSWRWSPADNQQGTGTSGLQLQRIEFHQYQKWAWKRLSSFRGEASVLAPWFRLHETLSREPCHAILDVWSTKLWDNKGVFF